MGLSESDLFCIDLEHYNMVDRLDEDDFLDNAGHHGDPGYSHACLAYLTHGNEPHGYPWVVVSRFCTYSSALLYSCPPSLHDPYAIYL